MLAKINRLEPLGNPLCGVNSQLFAAGREKMPLGQVITGKSQHYSPQSRFHTCRPSASPRRWAPQPAFAQKANAVQTSDKPLKILLTEGTSLSARQTLYALGGRHTLDVIDPNRLCQCRFSRLVRSWRQSPHFAKHPAEFLHFLADEIAREKYDVVLPTHEQVFLLSRFRDAVGNATGLALPPFASMQRMQNKAEFTRVLQSLNLPTPETSIATGAGDLRHNWKYPFYLKLAHSTAGAGVFHIVDEQELTQRVDELVAEGRIAPTTEILIQQPAKGTQATAQAVFDRGKMVGIHMFDARQLGVGGMSAARIGANHAIVRQHVQQLGASLDWHGAMFIDYFYDYETNQPEYIECNPRIGETVNAWLSGANLCEQLVQVSLGNPVEPLPISEPGTRTQSFMMILISKAFHGESRRGLLREIARYRFNRGIYSSSQDELTRRCDDFMSVLPLWWIACQLLASPARAKSIVAQTIENYSLPESAVEAIEALDVESFRTAFSRETHASEASTSGEVDAS